MDRSPAARDAVGTSAAMMVGGELEDSAAPSGDGGRGEGTQFGAGRKAATHEASTHWIGRARDGIECGAVASPNACARRACATAAVAVAGQRLWARCAAAPR